MKLMNTGITTAFVAICPVMFSFNAQAQTDNSAIESLGTCTSTPGSGCTNNSNPLSERIWASCKASIKPGIHHFNYL